MWNRAAETMPREQLECAMRGSVCFGVLTGERLVGFARAVTDLATYAYLCDVVVDPMHGRRRGEDRLVRCHRRAIRCRTTFHGAHRLTEYVVSARIVLVDR